MMVSNFKNINLYLWLCNIAMEHGPFTDDDDDD
jgi:hypothetical protein